MTRLLCMARVRMLALLVAICPFVSQSWATGPTTVPTAEYLPSGRYCGIYCLYTILSVHGRAPAMTELLKPQYVGSVGGSTLSELYRAARDFGFHAEVVGSLTTNELARSSDPVILFVKSAVSEKQYDHYILFLHADGDNAILYDPPRAIERVPFSALSARWSGIGLLVSKEPINIWRLFWPSWVPLFLIIALIGGVARLHHSWQRALPSSPRASVLGHCMSSLLQCTQLAAAGLVMGLVYHLWHSEGLLAHPTTTNQIVQAHEIGFLNKLGINAACRAVQNGTTVIDARVKRDYDIEHIDGAINIPVNADDTELRSKSEHIAKDAQIMLYCQSRSCPYAKKVASRLLREGYTNIVLFPGGWKEWLESRKAGGTQSSHGK